MGDIFDSSKAPIRAQATLGKAERLRAVTHVLDWSIQPGILLCEPEMTQKSYKRNRTSGKLSIVGSESH